MTAFKRILVAVDGSPLSAHATDLAIDLATDEQAQLAFVYVIDPRQAAAPEGGLSAATLLEMLRKEGHDVLTAASSRATIDPPPWQFLKEGPPVDGIIAAAREWRASLIVVASHGRSGVGRALLGSTSDGVVRHAPCPVLVVRSYPEESA